MSLDIQMLRDSFEVAKPIANDVVNHFYKTLFEDYPQAKPAFKGVDMAKQKQALIGSLVYIVDHLEDTGTLVDYLKKMGGRHGNYGVQPEHYTWVGKTLMKTFEHFFGDAWTVELNNQWAMAYNFIANTMIDGQYELAPMANGRAA